MKKILWLMIVPILLGACRKDRNTHEPITPPITEEPTAPTKPKYSLIEEFNTDDNVFHVEVMGYHGYTNGFNHIAWSIKDQEGNELKEADISIEIFDSQKHTLPHSKIHAVQSSGNPKRDLYFAGLCLMNSENPSGDYHINLHIEQGEMVDDVTLNIHADNTEDERIITFSPEGTDVKYLVALATPFAGEQAGNSEKIGFYIAQQNADGKWTTTQDIAANTCLTYKDQKTNFALLYTPDGFYTSSQTVQFNEADKYELQLNVIKENKAITENLPMSFTLKK